MTILKIFMWLVFLFGTFLEISLFMMFKQQELAQEIINSTPYWVLFTIQAIYLIGALFIFAFFQKTIFLSESKINKLEEELYKEKQGYIIAKNRLENAALKLN